jgi:hypothetical protein
MNESEIIALIRQDEWMMEILRAARGLNLPDWMIGAGFVRNKIWDNLHGYPERTPLTDIDLIFFDPKDVSWDREIKLEAQAKTLIDAPWSIKNQARMHLNNNDAPYESSTDALSRWVETPTCVAITLDGSGHVSLIAPFGIDDLINLRVAPNPKFPAPPQDYIARHTKKNWQKIWPRLAILPPQ